MKLVSIAAMLWVWMLACQACAFAYPRPQAQPFHWSCEQSQIVAVAEVESYQDEEDPVEQELQGNGPFSGSDVFLRSTKQQNPGTYRLRALKYLKGEAEAVISMQLPELNAYFFDSKIRIAPSDHVLLMAARDEKNTWKPVDPLRPLIPLAKNAFAAQPNAEEETPLSQVQRLMLGSMAEPTLRRMHAYLLRDTSNPQLIPGLAAYIDDDDARVREHVIQNMAVNQQVSVIPRIVALSETAWRESKGMYSGANVTNLRMFTVPQARPHLNQALLSRQQFTRVNALSPLVKLADRSSVPYLLFTLFDSDLQKSNVEAAYFILHRILPALGEPKSREEFWKNRDAETARLLAWWRDELSGKHPKAEDTPPSPLIDFARVGALKSEDAARILNPLLFDLKLKQRQDAASALQKHADRSRIPFLLLALHDPDGEVSYLAYRALHRLIDTMPPPTSRPQFEAKREAHTQKLFDWWRDELLGKHFPPDPAPKPAVKPAAGAPIAPARPPAG